MKIFFDTEFLEDGKTIELISIGMIREDGAFLYMENSEFDQSKATDWLKENVLPKLTGQRFTREEIKQTIIEFVGDNPEFWAYYADYDWVCLCQLFGTMMDLPDNFPKYCKDFKQELDRFGIKIDSSSKDEHNALEDAKWLQNEFNKLKGLKLT